MIEFNDVNGGQLLVREDGILAVQQCGERGGRLSRLYLAGGATIEVDACTVDVLLKLREATDEGAGAWGTPSEKAEARRRFLDTYQLAMARRTSNEPEAP